MNVWAADVMDGVGVGAGGAAMMGGGGREGGGAFGGLGGTGLDCVLDVVGGLGSLSRNEVCIEVGLWEGV